MSTVNEELNGLLDMFSSNSPIDIEIANKILSAQVDYFFPEYTTNKSKLFIAAKRIQKMLNEKNNATGIFGVKNETAEIYKVTLKSKK